MIEETLVYEIDGKDYILVNKIVKDDHTYLYFGDSDSDDDYNYVIRKLAKDNGFEMVPLDSEEEVIKALGLLTEN